MESEICSPRNKRFKTLAQSPTIDKSGIQSSPNRHNHHNESTDCCGICLSEGVISRGFIDSCNHYFCFICIREWAKVESKCPLCKRRFSTIRRPPKPPLFHSERLVRVPIRDQVYCNFGNATTGPPDPYSEVNCSVCHSIADEHLILLCDLCDTAAHTFCIGLGVTVPEGDWFCQDCTLLRRENLEYESNTNSHSESNIPTIPKLLSVNENVSISDIVQESYGGVQGSRAAVSHLSYLPTPRSGNETPTLELVANHPAKSNARTLRVCHNVRDRIRILRENWDKFQSGKLSFSTDRSVNNIQVSVSCVRGNNPVSTLSQQSTFESLSSNATNGSRENEIRKAWKMLARAKSVKQGCRKSDIVHSSPKPSMRKKHGHKVADAQGPVGVRRHIQRVLTKDGNIGPGHHGYCSREDYSKQHLVYGKQDCGTSIRKTVMDYSGVSISPSFSFHQELPSLRRFQASSQWYRDKIDREKLAAEKTLERPLLLSSSSKPVVSSGDNIRDISTNKDKNTIVKSNVDGSSNQSKQYIVAKSEIQSLVKLNLNLQLKDEKLEANVFKDVARLATHSILAACGLEEPRLGYCSPNVSVCSHPRELSELQRSSLMPNSCSACFYVFVKDMVTASMLQKKCKQERYVMSG